DRAQEWLYGHLFLYGVRDEALARLGVENRAQIPTTARLGPADFENDADALVWRGRLVGIGLALGLGGCTFLWSRQLFGPSGGLLTLALFAFDPNLVAHAALVASDVGLALFALAALLLLWRACRRIHVGNAVGLGSAVALAIVTDLSGLLLPLVV